MGPHGAWQNVPSLGTRRPLSLWIPLRGRRQLTLLSAGRTPGIFGEDTRVGKKNHTHTQKNLTPKFIMQRCKSHHLCNQTCETSANEQLVCVCVAGAVQSQSCYQILTAEPSDCSSGPVCVMHKYSITLRLASFSPDLPDYLKPGTLFPFVLLK